MPKRLCCAALFAALSVQSVGARAEPTANPKPVTEAEPRRDPSGIKGISPFREALSRGDAALLTRDLEGAIVAYREALAKEPENALGHYRLGEARVLKGDLHEAEVAFSAGLRFVKAPDLTLKAKLQFGLAELRERQKAYDEASAQWTEYEAFATEQPAAHAFPASGRERKRVIEAWKKLSADAQAVKTRIDKGLQAADEAVKKSSK